MHFHTRQHDLIHGVDVGQPLQLLLDIWSINTNLRNVLERDDKIKYAIRIMEFSEQG